MCQSVTNSALIGQKYAHIYQHSCLSLSLLLNLSLSDFISLSINSKHIGQEYAHIYQKAASLSLYPSQSVTTYWSGVCIFTYQHCCLSVWLSVCPSPSPEAFLSLSEQWVFSNVKKQLNLFVNVFVCKGTTFLYFFIFFYSNKTFFKFTFCKYLSIFIA